MKIYFAHAEAVPSEYSNIPRLATQLDAQRGVKRHFQVDNPEQADVVLFPECHLLQRDWLLRCFTSSAVARAFPGKLAVYDERDLPWCRLPGVYVSMPKAGFVPRWQVPGSYWHAEHFEERLGPGWADVKPDLLFSFVGSVTHPCRGPILALKAARSYIEPVTGFMFWDPSSPRFEERRRAFAEVTARSKFVLCPRGHGTASIRLFEVLSAGRVPVVISDEWVPPVGPNWPSFSVRWPSARVAELPAALERLEGNAEEMGCSARAAYDEWFAHDVVLARQLDQLEQLLRRPDGRRFPRHGCRNSVYYRGRGRETVAVLRSLRHGRRTGDR